MQRRQWIATAITMTMLFGTPAAVLAEKSSTPTSPGKVTATATAGQNEWAEKLRKLFNLSSAYELSSFSQAEQDGTFGEGTVYMFSFRKDTLADKESLNVTIEAKTGDIVSFNFYDSKPDKAGTPLQEPAARAKALEWVKKLYPSKAAHLDKLRIWQESGKGVYPPDAGVQTFSYGMVRTVNGLPVVNDGFQVTVDDSGRLLSLSGSWSGGDDASFPAAEPAVKAAAAKDVYAKDLPIELRYMTRQIPGSRTPEIRLAYAAAATDADALLKSAASSLPLLDAATGQLITTNGEEVRPIPPRQPLADKPGQPLASKELGKEEAVALAKTLMGLGDSYALLSSEYGSSGGSKEWRLEFHKKDGQKEQRVYLYLDALTGEVRNLNNYEGKPSSGESKPAVLKWEEGKAKAIEFIKRAFPASADKIVLLSDTQPSGLEGREEAYMYLFGKQVNGIATDGLLRVSVSAADGAVRDVYNDSFPTDAKGAKLPFPDPSKKLEGDKARQLFADRYPLELKYIPTYAPGEPGKSKTFKGYKLAYVPNGFERSLVVDALKGELFSLSSYDKQEPKKVGDIAGHWAEKQLQYMADQGIYTLEGDKIRPEQTIHRGDVIRILVRTMASPMSENAMKSSSDAARPPYADIGRDDSNYEYIETAVALGWLPKDTQDFRPDEPMTREQLAEIGVRVLGYQKLASKPNLFQQPFQDLADSQAHVGSIAIMKALGIMNGNGTTFGPKGHLSRAELAVVFTRLQAEKPFGLPFVK